MTLQVYLKRGDLEQISPEGKQDIEIESNVICQRLGIQAPGAIAIDRMQWNKHSPSLLVAVKSL